MRKKLKILLIITAFIVLGMVAARLGTASEVIRLHDPSCHKDYDDQDDCRHPCDHTFCECQKECYDDCKVNEEVCNDCRGACYRGNAKCVNKCCEDGKIDC